MFWYIYRLPLHVALILTVIAPTLWAVVTGLVFNSSKVVRFVNSLACIVSIAGIIYITLIRPSSGERELILAPFHSFIEAREQKEVYRSMIMNVALFAPFGLTLPYVISKTGKPTLNTILIAFTLSVIIETLQFVFGLGRCETDDVICNTLGAAICSSSFCISEKIRKCKKAEQKTE